MSVPEFAFWVVIVFIIAPLWYFIIRKIGVWADLTARERWNVLQRRQRQEHETRAVKTTCAPVQGEDPPCPEL